mgnify:CR=1 FL=1
MHSRQHYNSAGAAARDAEEAEHLAMRTAHIQLNNSHTHSVKNSNKHKENISDDEGEVRNSSPVIYGDSGRRLSVRIPSLDEEEDKSSISSYESYYSDGQDDNGIGLDEMLEEMDAIDEDGYVHPYSIEQEEDMEEESTGKVLWYRCHRGRVMMWMRFARVCRVIADGKWFTSFIFVCIIMAGIVVGLQTYPKYENDHTLYV